MNNQKTFVLDTNVILHDHKCIYNFDENDVVIPIVVLEEIDKFKKGNEIINYNAREFTRELDKISGNLLFKEGVSLGANKGKLYVVTGKAFSEDLKESFFQDTPDHRILAVADYIKKEKPNTVLITKDINLRLKAKSLGIVSQDYETGKIKDIKAINKVIPTVNNINDAIISRLYKNFEGVPIEDFKFAKLPEAHKYSIYKSEKSSVLTHFDPINNVINRVVKRPYYGIEPRNAEQTFSLDALSRPEIQLVSLTGKAGTGKTLLALAAALHQINNFEQVLLARPIVPLSNRDLGFLPGDVKDKIGPYMQPLFDNLSVIKHKFKSTSKEYLKIEEYLKEEKLVITPLAYIRGRSLSNVFFIVDEAQNLTPHEVKTIITRAGEGTKIIFTGDIQQIDSPYLDEKSNGLSYLSEKMRGQKIFTHVNLLKGERSYLAELASNLL
ncbi:MAG: PhoH family protein [Bacteroidales bacterium]|nr:PhoH family protein [Bacteroidales bacterium]